MNLRTTLVLAAALLSVPALLRADENLPGRYRGPGIAVRGPGECDAPAPEEDARLLLPAGGFVFLADLRIGEIPAGISYG